MHPFIRISQLLVRLGAIEGRKKLQKIVHILQSTGAPFEEKFELSHFGAYSSELRGEVAKLAKDDLVQEEEPTGCAGSYIYRPTAALQALVKELSVSLDEPWLDLAEKLNLRSAQELEGISTVLYLKRWGWSQEGLRQQFSALKPHLVKDFDACRQEADSLVS